VLVSVVVRRMLMLPLVVSGVVLVTFFISRVAPGDPAQLIAGPRASPEELAAIRERLNLDAPLPEQFTAYIGSLAQGDLGQSIMSGRPVADEIFSYMPATLELMLCAFLLTVLVGVPLGVLTALYRDRLPDIGGRLFAIAGISIPTFWLGLLLLLLFYSVLGISPGAGRLDSASHHRQIRPAFM
jgi:peptide/nickel transport system permease protein